MKLDIPYGYCHCGCGAKTKVAKRSSARYGHVKGEPIRFVNGHQRRKSAVEHLPEDRGYATPCWIWQRYIDASGYGQRGDGERLVRAHRYEYERAHGPIPDGLQLDHLCRVRSCVNPEHLELVSSAENTRRGILTKLTTDDVRAIRAEATAELERRRAAGFAQRTRGWQYEMGRRYGVSRTTIQHVVGGISWRDV